MHRTVLATALVIASASTADVAEQVELTGEMPSIMVTLYCLH
jgi:hypothetical protein